MYYYQNPYLILNLIIFIAIFEYIVYSSLLISDFSFIIFYFVFGEKPLLFAPDSDDPKIILINIDYSYYDIINVIKNVQFKSIIVFSFLTLLYFNLNNLNEIDYKDIFKAINNIIIKNL